MFNYKLPPAVQPIVKSITTTSILTKVVFFIVSIGYFCSYSEGFRRVFTITPQLLLPPNFWIWTVVTYCFVEQRILIVLCDFVCFHLCSKLIEPLWGQTEIVKYFAIVNVVVAFLTTMVFLGLYALMSDIDFLFHISVHGLSGFNGALVVAVRQILPDDTVIATPVGKIKNCHLPMLVMCVLLILTVLRLFSYVYFSMYVVGVLTGWIYLRFYQKHGNGSQGDLADHFSFASFFPTVVQPFVAVLCNTVFNILVQVKVCKPAIRRYNMSAPHSVVTLPGMDTNDAERRRQKALKELNDRLSKSKEQSLPAWPTMDDTAEMSDSQPPVRPHSPPLPPSTQGTVSSSPKKSQSASAGLTGEPPQQAETVLDVDA